jgi:DegV family protein with EDD domain
MSSVCILTDSTAQFTKPTYPGRNLVTILPIPVEFENQVYTDGKDLKLTSLPPTLQNAKSPCLGIPTSEEIKRTYLQLGQDYNEILAVFMSSHLSPLVQNAQEAAEAVRGRVAVQVVDSQTISIGLGTLVQSAAEAASEGVPSTEVERLLRGVIPHIYSVLCIPSLTYLNQSGFIGSAQAIVGEMLGLLPIYTLEDGYLTSVEKARNYRQLMDYLQEFVDEFSDLDHIAFIQSVPPMIHEARMLREHAALLFPKTPFSEHNFSLPTAILFGPRTLGVFAIESEDSRE